MFTTLTSMTAVAAETLTLGTAVVVTSPFTRRLHEPILRLWARGVVKSARLDLQVEGTENIQPGQRYVFVANHQSYLDVPCLVQAIPAPLRFIAKRSLFRIPLFGRAIRDVGMVDIDRNDKADALRKLEEAQKGIAQTCCLLFFAEGTRRSTGGLGPFKKGAVATAQSLGVPLIPVAIEGTGAALPKGVPRLTPGRVRVAIGHPLAPGTPERRDETNAAVRAEVARLLRGIGGSP